MLNTSLSSSSRARQINFLVWAILYPNWEANKGTVYPIYLNALCRAFYVFRDYDVKLFYKELPFLRPFLIELDFLQFTFLQYFLRFFCGHNSYWICLNLLNLFLINLVASNIAKSLLFEMKTFAIFIVGLYAHYATSLDRCNWIIRITYSSMSLHFFLNKCTSLSILDRSTRKVFDHLWFKNSTGPTVSK